MAILILDLEIEVAFLTVDGRPFFGKAPGVEGFLLNAGWGGVGIIQAPVAGQLMAELVRDGQTSTFESKEFELERFGL